MALYESLTASSSPAEIAKAYAEFAAGAGGDTTDNQDAARTFLESRGIAATTIEQAYNQFAQPAAAPTLEQIANTPGMGATGIGVTGFAVPSELDLFNAQTEAQLKADEEAFNKARAEIKALTQQEEDEIKQQNADYQAAIDLILQQQQAQAQAAALEQAIIQKQLADIQALQAEEADKFKANMEGMQRDSAQRKAAAKKAGRSAGGGLLLGGATPGSMGQGGQSLGSNAPLSGQTGSLGAQQTLGVGA